LSRIEHFTKLSVQIVVYNSLIYSRSLQTFLPEGHINYCTAVQESDILHYVIVAFLFSNSACADETKKTFCEAGSVIKPYLKIAAWPSCCMAESILWLK